MRWEESRRRRKEVRRPEKRRREKKEDAGAQKGRKVAILYGSGGSKSTLAKAAGAEPACCTPLWREAHFQVKSVKNWRVRNTFGSFDVEKVCAAVARNKFPSQNVQDTPRLAHFWKLRGWKSGRRCGGKEISKLKCTKHTRFGPLLEIQMSKKVRAVVARSIFPRHVRTTFDGWDVVLRGRRKGLWTLPKVSKT